MTLNSSSRRISGEEEVITEDPNFERKLDLITEGSRKFLKDHLLTRITGENCTTIINYILAMQTEVISLSSYRLNPSTWQTVVFLPIVGLQHAATFPVDRLLTRDNKVIQCLSSRNQEYQWQSVSILDSLTLS
jgi:hypothetical protein